MEKKNSRGVEEVYKDYGVVARKVVFFWLVPYVHVRSFTQIHKHLYMG